jgi:SAM-dependent methyltransferase
LAVSGYTAFARFYDALMDDPSSRSGRVADCIRRYMPGAKSILELGCGTGAVLAGLDPPFSVAGIDLSPQMLEVARWRIPRARLLEANMTDFSLDERFDVVICVFDTLNHVESFEGWRAVFDRVHRHLVEGGLFIFDINPIGRLRALSESPPWVHDFDRNVVIIAVELDGASMSTWDIRVFERLHDGRFELHHERIRELGVPLADVKDALATGYELLEEDDPDGNAPSDSSQRAYFVYRRAGDARTPAGRASTH